jgi:membrane protein DedA with SNARE-associated domain
MEEFLRQYGYLALALGTFVEGETAMLVAASLVYSGTFGWLGTVFFGFFGSFVSDWLFYLIGKINGTYFVERRPAIKARLEPARRFFEAHRLQVLVSYRFLYGFRIVLPLLIGLTGVRPLHFLGYSVVAGLLWSSSVTSVGFLAGKFFELSPASYEQHGFLVILGFALVGLTIGLTVKRVTERRLDIPPKPGKS